MRPPTWVAFTYFGERNIKIEIIKPADSDSMEGYYIDKEGVIFYVDSECKVFLAHAVNYGEEYVPVGLETYVSEADLKTKHQKLPDCTKDYISYSMVEGRIRSAYHPGPDVEVDESHVGLYEYEGGSIFLFPDERTNQSGVCIKSGSQLYSSKLGTISETLTECTDKAWKKLPAGTKIIITV